MKPRVFHASQVMVGGEASADERLIVMGYAAHGRDLFVFTDGWVTIVTSDGYYTSARIVSMEEAIAHALALQAEED
ncbi:hypothetical protein [Alloyangia pacifica]|uniref:Uncharacterized protein n=1 Tax=Alloyangia pacifica TaxID=311180 RepID=A0A1I6PP97_9RHOB|nr:hypothetical protein [Alloyangia pacifica]SDG32464.1 hypothetical protein SAMN04488245_102372 [Alloyangia pacifica]SFS41940.1 hypothetical protein SAMN04488050_101673 [Alloyangia pacifica]